MRGLARAIATLAVLVVSGCGGGPPPITSMAGRSCTDNPDFAAARPLMLGKNDSATVDVDQTAACWQMSDGGRSAYVLFSLPDSATPYLVTVTSQLVGQTLFAPRVVMFDAAGAPLRSMARDAFMFHGTTLYLGIRAYPGERYLLVASEPQTVGQQSSQLKAGTQDTYAVSGPYMVQIHTGFEKNQDFTYGVNGKVAVAVRAMPKAD